MRLERGEEKEKRREGERIKEIRLEREEGRGRDVYFYPSTRHCKKILRFYSNPTRENRHWTLNKIFAGSLRIGSP